jgi:hypothetical protein
LQALKFNIKSFDCSVDSESIEVKSCFVKSLEQDTYVINLNIVYIKEMTKLQVKSNRVLTCRQNKCVLSNRICQWFSNFFKFAAQKSMLNLSRGTIFCFNFIRYH